MSGDQKASIGDPSPEVSNDMSETRQAVPLHSVTETAKILGCSDMHVYRLIAAGQLRAVDIATPGAGRTKNRIRSDDLADYTASTAGGTGKAARKIRLGDEDADFTIHAGNAADGVIWVTLRCSVHGNIGSLVEWDLGMLNAVAENHYAREHLRPDQRGQGPA